MRKQVVVDSIGGNAVNPRAQSLTRDKVVDGVRDINSDGLGGSVETCNRDGCKKDGCNLHARTSECAKRIIVLKRFNCTDYTVRGTSASHRIAVSYQRIASEIPQVLKIRRPFRDRTLDSANNFAKEKPHAASFPSGFSCPGHRPHLIFRMRKAHQPFVEPSHNIVEPLDAMPRLSRAGQFMRLSRKDDHGGGTVQKLKGTE